MKQTFKTIAAIILLTCIATAANAKSKKGTHQNAHTRLLRHRAYIQNMAMQRQSVNTPKATANKTTGELQERLIASSEYDLTDSVLHIIGIIDSNRFVYSGEHSSLFDYNHMYYDPIYYIDGSLPMGYGGELGFADHNNQPSILFDTAYYWQAEFYWDSFSYDGLQYAQYDTNNNIIYFFDSTYWADDDITINTFDGSQNITNSFSMISDYPSGWDTSENRFFAYSGGQVITDSTNAYAGGGVWQPEEKWQYGYDGAGNITSAFFYLDSSGVWSLSERFYMYYYADNKLAKDSFSFNQTGAWLPQGMDTFGYTTGIDFVTYEKNRGYDQTTGNPLGDIVTTKHVSLAGLPDTMYQIDYGLITGDTTENSKYAFIYDGFGEPTEAFQYNVNIYGTGSGPYDSTPDYVYHYYYETFYKTTGVNNTPLPNRNLAVYPNPATNIVYINQSGFIQGSLTKLTLINASGQVVITESIPWQNETESISLSGLVPGAYWIIVSDKSGNTLCRRQITKL